MPPLQAARLQATNSVKTHLLSLLLATAVLLPAQPAPVHGSASLASVHVCAVYDCEQWRRDHPRPAGKRLADLDAGEFARCG